MQEYILNLHMHTPYSDGTGSHEEIAQAALRAGIDVVIVTDHNVWVKGPERYYQEGDRRVLLLVGEEVHDQTLRPQKNHLLIFGVDQEMAPYARDPQALIHRVHDCGGLSFIAHLVDPEAPKFNEPDLSWVNWDISGFTGIELWNAMSEFKSLLKSKFHALYYAYNPEAIARGPFPETIQKWDELLREGSRVVAVGGSDAHAMRASLGPLRRALFPYEFHFRAVNTHIFTEKPLTGDYESDRQAVLDALRKGHAHVGYDLPFPTKGFRFSAQGMGESAWMGDSISSQNGVTLQIRLPRRTECVLLKDGKSIKTWKDREVASHITTEAGVYRVEAYITYRRKRRAWIFSNPIYVR